MSNAPVSAGVHFSDPRLESAIRDHFIALGRPLGANIAREDLVGVGFTRLDASHRGIRDLEGIQACEDLEFAELSYNAIADVTPLAALTRMRDLFLGIGDFESAPGSALPLAIEKYTKTNRITDIRPLAALTELHYLDLAGNNDLRDISVIGTFSNLKWLTLGNNEIEDYSVLGTIPWLENFGNPYGNMTDKDLAFIAGCTEMLRLGIPFNKVTNLNPLARWHRIYALVAQHNRITDISGIETCNKLDWVFLQGNLITDIAPLANNPGIRRNDVINIGQNPIPLENANRYIPIIQARLWNQAIFAFDAPLGEGRALTVSVEGNGRTQPPAGVSQRLKGSRVMVYAMPVAGSGVPFDGWEAGVEDAHTPVAQVVMDDDRAVRAAFRGAADHTLHVEVKGDCLGEVYPGIGGPFAYRHDQGALLYAQPFPGFYFGGWSGDVDSPTPMTALLMDRDKRVVASFGGEGATLTLGAGPGGEVRPPAGTYPIVREELLPVTASPHPGHRFSHWEGDVDDIDASRAGISVTFDKDRALTAVFAPDSDRQL